MIAVNHFIILFTAMALAVRAEDSPRTSQEFQAAFRGLQAAQTQHVQAVEAAIENALQTKTLHSSTETYYLSVLNAFRALPEVYSQPIPQIPPRFDTSEEMESINLAWHRLDLVTRQNYTQLLVLTRQAMDLCEELMDRAVKHGEKAEDFDEPLRLAAIARRHTDFEGPVIYDGLSRLNPRPIFMLSADAAVEMQEAMRARQVKDYSRMSESIRRLSASARMSSVSTRPGAVEPMLAEFTRRLVRDYQEDLRPRQEALERALIARKPKAELERMLSELSTLSGETNEMKKIATSPLRFSRERSDPSARPDNPGPLPPVLDRSSAIRVYQAVISFIGGPENKDSPPLPELSGHEMFALDAEFRAFFESLRNKARAN